MRSELASFGVVAALLVVAGSALPEGQVAARRLTNERGIAALAKLAQLQEENGEWRLTFEKTVEDVRSGLKIQTRGELYYKKSKEALSMRLRVMRPKARESQDFVENYESVTMGGITISRDFLNKIESRKQVTAEEAKGGLRELAKQVFPPPVAFDVQAILGSFDVDAVWQLVRDGTIRVTLVKQPLANWTISKLEIDINPETGEPRRVRVFGPEMHTVIEYTYERSLKLELKHFEFATRKEGSWVEEVDRRQLRLPGDTDR